MKAVKMGLTEIAAKLLVAGADVNAKSIDVSAQYFLKSRTFR